MNYGTPQEMIDEENDFNPKSENERLRGCICTVFFILIVFLITYILW